MSPLHLTSWVRVASQSAREATDVTAKEEPSLPRHAALVSLN